MDSRSKAASTTGPVLISVAILDGHTRTLTTSVAAGDTNVAPSRRAERLATVPGQVEEGRRKNARPIHPNSFVRTFSPGDRAPACTVAFMVQVDSPGAMTTASRHVSWAVAVCSSNSARHRSLFHRGERIAYIACLPYSSARNMAISASEQMYGHDNSESEKFVATAPVAITPVDTPRKQMFPNCRVPFMAPSLVLFLWPLSVTHVCVDGLRCCLCAVHLPSGKLGL